MTLTNRRIWYSVFANDNDAFIPEIWAAESLMILFENIVLAGLVHTDFSDEIAQAGDVVNTRRPAKFVSKRKVDADNVTDQDATSTNVPVALDLHEHVSFVIKDGEESKGFMNLRNTYLEPAVQAIARGVEEDIAGTRYEFLSNRVGNLGTTITKPTIIEATAALDQQLCPQVGRNFVFSPQMKGDILNQADLTTADKIGDQGTIMRTGSLGDIFGLRSHMSQNIHTYLSGDVDTGTQDILVNNAAGYAAGTTVITVDGRSGGLAPVPGEWVTIEGDDTPQILTSVTGAGTPTSITIAPGLKRAVANNADVVHHVGGLVNLAAGYAAGYNKDLIVDNLTLTPRVGAPIGTATGTAQYGLRSTPTTTLLQLNKSLDATLADDAVVGIGPAGEYGFAFHRNAIALVSRPLALPAQGTGALSAVQSMNGIGMRVTITYDGQAQGHRVTVDLLAGVKTLDTNLGCLVLG